MSHTIYWPQKTFFYPTGNTSPICLTQDIPPEQSAHILSLGCGDPRNILYTIYASALDENSLPRSLDFTCCDVEPAILARNFLLFSLLAENESDGPIDTIWNIFYDFFLKRPTFDLLTAHSRKLLDCSQDLETWNQSNYGRFLKFCSRHTFDEVRQCWTRYANFDELPASRKSKVKSSFVDGMKHMQGKNVVSVGRSAGPLVPEGLMPTSEHFTHFWKTGINSMDAKDRTGADLVNPTFAYSAGKEGFDVHYGTDCLAAFHLAVAFADVKGSPTRLPFPPKPQSAVSSARAQFAAWCQAFKTAIAVESASRIVVRAFAGEALAFCDALHYCFSTSLTSTPSTVIPWKGTLITLDGDGYDKDTSSPAPLEFDVIDTSNLTDHLGLLNVLTVTTPLLSRRPYSTIYTETLLPLGENAVSRFQEHLCGDMATTCMLLDIAPSAFLSRFTTSSNVHEIAIYHVFESQAQFHERTSWKILSLADSPPPPTDGVHRPLRLTFEPHQLASFFLGIYHKMFGNEDPSFLMNGPTKEKLQASSTIHYVRASYVTFLRVVQARLQDQANWHATMDILFDLLDEDNTLLLGMNNYQDLCCQLHYYNVFSVDTFMPNSSTGRTYFRQSETFRGWADVPTMVCLTLVVPRNQLRQLEQLDVGTPPLWCEITGPNFLNYFSTFRPVFGRLVATGTCDARHLSIDEDAASDLVVSFWVPTFVVAQQPAATRISLSVRATPASQQLQMSLGLQMKLHTATLLDKRQVYITRERPDAAGEVEKIRAMSFTHFNGLTTSNVSVQMNKLCTRVASLTRRIDILDVKAQEALANGAIVSEEQVSPCAIRVTFNEVEETAFLPFPVDGTRTKLRIARKSHYIEIVATPIGGISSLGGFFVNQFPLIFDKTVPTLWNMHRVNLDRLPALDTTDKARLGRWLNAHVSLSLSDRETPMRSGGQHATQDVLQALVDVKETLHMLFIRHAGIQGDGAHRIFALSDPARGGIYTLLFIAALRLDLPAHTVLLDTYALPMTIARVQRLQHLLVKLQPVSVLTAGAEMTAWKRLLPAFAERCRTRWVHGPNCEYVAAGGRAPRSLEYAEDPLCGCGAGRDGDAFRTAFPEWADAAPFMTRVAISPLFAVSYLESVAGRAAALGKGMPNVAQPVAASSSTSGCARCGSSGAKLLVCARCKRVKYCSAECQKADWKRHKPTCK